MSLRNRILTAGAWTLGAYASEFIVRLVSNLVMTRMLFPEAFGLIAASTSIIMGLAVISDFGVRAVVIQSEHGSSESFLRSAWVFQLSRGVVLWLILTVFSAFASLSVFRNMVSSTSVFADPLFPVVTIVLGFSLVLNGMESTILDLNLRRLQFRSNVIIDVIGKFIALPVMIVFAAFMPSVWALVAGSLSGGLLRVVLSHIALQGPKMAFKWQSEHIDEIWHFGKWITVSSIASFFGSSSDIFVLGAILPASFLGIYIIAKTIISSIEGLLERLNGSLSLSVFREVIRKNPLDLRKRYYQFRLPIEATALVSAGAIMATGPQIIKVLYDARYVQAGTMLQILSLALAIYPFQLIRSAFTAVGEPRIAAGVSIIEALSLLCLLPAGFFAVGPVGAIFGVGVARLVPSVMILYLGYRRGWIGIWRELYFIPLFLIGFLAGQSCLGIARAFNLPVV